MTKDTVNLRENAAFYTKIYPGVYWIPVNTLGKSRLTNEDIEKLKNKSPEIKREKIKNLYELIQLLQIGGFEVVDDNIYEQHNGLQWEKHRTGYDAVRLNQGCCASVASFGNYILEGKYEEVGLVGISSLSGNGHVVNYIMHHSCIYIIDLFAMTNKFVSEICVETGFKRDYIKTSIPTSILMKVDSFEDFANFFSKFMYLRSKEYLFFQHSSVECSQIAVKIHKGKTIIFLPKTNCIKEIKYSKNSPHMEVCWIEDREE
ncbi:hypothetical protein V1225_09365 [Emergencia sp. JLR.KK010]|jgi:hypothetical protein|uniref:hypothetical protein n=1 Tax=Anaerovoracaceae TaxID=543314 RepID=UPI0020409C98|nr:hypothetical protein [Senimuribacter intestinalis]